MNEILGINWKIDLFGMLSIFRKLDIIGTCEDGNFFYLSATSDSSRLTHEVWGHLYHPNGFLYKINACNLDLEKLGENGPVPRHFSLRFSAKRRHYHAIIHLMPNQFENFTGLPWRHQSTIYPCHLTLNARQGRVLFTATNTFHGHCPLVDVKVCSGQFLGTFMRRFWKLIGTLYHSFKANRTMKLSTF